MTASQIHSAQSSFKIDMIFTISMHTKYACTFLNLQTPNFTLACHIRQVSVLPITVKSVQSTYAIVRAVRTRPARFHVHPYDPVTLNGSMTLGGLLLRLVHSPFSTAFVML